MSGSECWICRRPVSQADNNVYLPCGDPHHDDCLRRMARYLATVYGRTDTRCPRCASFVSEHIVRLLLWDMRRVCLDAWIHANEPNDVFRVEIRNETQRVSPPVVRYVRVRDMPMVDLTSPIPLLVPASPPPAADADAAQHQPPAYASAAAAAATSPPPAYAPAAQHQPPASADADSAQQQPPTGQEREDEREPERGRYIGKPGLRDLRK